MCAFAPARSCVHACACMGAWVSAPKRMSTRACCSGSRVLGSSGAGGELEAVELARDLTHAHAHAHTHTRAHARTGTGTRTSFPCCITIPLSQPEQTEDRRKQPGCAKARFARCVAWRGPRSHLTNAQTRGPPGQPDLEERVPELGAAVRRKDVAHRAMHHPRAATRLQAAPTQIMFARVRQVGRKSTARVNERACAAQVFRLKRNSLAARAGSAAHPDTCAARTHAHIRTRAHHRTHARAQRHPDIDTDTGARARTHHAGRACRLRLAAALQLTQRLHVPTPAV
jgi:hypothetical protein